MDGDEETMHCCRSLKALGKKNSLGVRRYCILFSRCFRRRRFFFFFARSDEGKKATNTPSLLLHRCCCSNWNGLTAFDDDMRSSIKLEERRKTDGDIYKERKVAADADPFFQTTDTDRCTSARNGICEDTAAAAKRFCWAVKWLSPEAAARQQQQLSCFCFFRSLGAKCSGGDDSIWEEEELTRSRRRQNLTGANEATTPGKKRVLSTRLLDVQFLSYSIFADFCNLTAAAAVLFALAARHHSRDKLWCISRVTLLTSFLSDHKQFCLGILLH